MSVAPGGLPHHVSGAPRSLVVHIRHSYRFCRPLAVMGVISLIVGAAGAGLATVDALLAILCASFAVTIACAILSLTDPYVIVLCNNGGIRLRNRLGVVVNIHEIHKLRTIAAEELDSYGFCARTPFDDYSCGPAFEHVLVELLEHAPSLCCHVRQSFVFCPLDRSAKEIVNTWEVRARGEGRRETGGRGATGVELVASPQTPPSASPSSSAPTLPVSPATVAAGQPSKLHNGDGGGDDAVTGAAAPAEPQYEESFETRGDAGIGVVGVTVAAGGEEKRSSPAIGSTPPELKLR